MEIRGHICVASRTIGLKFRTRTIFFYTGLCVLVSIIFIVRIATDFFQNSALFDILHSLLGLLCSFNSRSSDVICKHEKGVISQARAEAKTAQRKVAWSKITNIAPMM